VKAKRAVIDSVTTLYITKHAIARAIVMQLKSSFRIGLHIDIGFPSQHD